MTDNKIIKALEEEIHLVEYVDGFSADNVDLELLKNILDLIKRQQAEIERLNKPQGVTFLANGIEIHTKDSDEYYKFKRLVKTEAIREFSEKLKHHTRKMCGSDFGGEFWDKAVLVSEIDNLVKEMIEEDK